MILPYIQDVSAKNFPDQEIIAKVFKVSESRLFISFESNVFAIQRSKTKKWSDISENDKVKISTFIKKDIRGNWIKSYSIEKVI